MRALTTVSSARIEMVAPSADMREAGISTRPVRSGEKMALAERFTVSACDWESENASRTSFVTWSPPTPSTPAWIMRPSAKATYEEEPPPRSMSSVPAALSSGDSTASAAQRPAK